MIKKIKYNKFDLFNSNLLYIPIIVLSFSIIYDIYIIKCVLENLNVTGAVKEKIVYKSLFL